MNGRMSWSRPPFSNWRGERGLFWGLAKGFVPVIGPRWLSHIARYCSNHPASTGSSRVKSNSSKDVKLHWMRPTPLLRLFAGYRHRAVSIIFFFYFHRNYEEGSSRIPASHYAALQRMADRWPLQRNAGIEPLNPETAWEWTTKVEMRLIGFDSGYGFFSKSSLYYFLFIYSLFLFIWLRHRL